MTGRGPIWRQPGMPPLVVMTCAGFSGYALLLTVAPLWAVEGGATTAGSGLVNGVLLLFTVLTQLLVPRALQSFGWGPVLAVGLALLGVPGVLLSLSDELGWILALSAVRGIGFGVLTVTGSAAVGGLVEARRRGEAIGAYGLAVAVPNLVLLPAGPWIAETVGYWVVFTMSALPLVGIPAALRLASALRVTAPDLHPGATTSADPRDPEVAAYRRLMRPMMLLLAVTLAGGAVITFTPQMVDSASVAAGGLLLMGLAAALSRWRFGVFADRYGAQRFLVPLVPLTGVGMALVAWSVADSGDVRVGAFLVAMLLIGLCYGALQNLTLLISFEAVSRRHHNLASSVWNVGFDAGTALGSVAVGAIAQVTSFATAFLVAGAIAVATLPLALLRPATPSLGPVTTLPDVIDRYYTAAAAGDLDAVLSCFSADAHVHDEDRDHDGLDAIRGWREGVANRFTYTTEITGVDQVGDGAYVVHTHLEGDFPGGVVDLQQRFTVTDGLITDLVI